MPRGMGIARAHAVPRELRERGSGQAATHVSSVFCVEQSPRPDAKQLLRLAGPGERGALPGRVQPALPHLPQRRPGLAAGAAAGPGPGRGALLARDPAALAGRGHGERRRAHGRPGPAPLPGRRQAHRPAGQGGHQRHAAGRGGGAALRRPGRRVRGGREGPLRQVPRGERGHGQRRDRPAQPGVDLRPGPPPSGTVLFPDHHGSGLGHRGPRRHPGASAPGRGPCPATVRASGEGTCPSRF